MTPPKRQKMFLSKEGGNQMRRTTGGEALPSGSPMYWNACCNCWLLLEGVGQTYVARGATCGARLLNAAVLSAVTRFLSQHSSGVFDAAQEFAMSSQQDFALARASALRAKLMAGVTAMASPRMKPVNLRDMGIV
jgi:hypothetical protein